ncbi:MAG: hypothetical protein H6574_24515 [Lewinellaceae bacterium]|nr:hypothetical protein [Saprospiraceae bacterium]MCB9314651.1 hypothetical protein [Lewinellaceae bacterium]MCB9334224.1 hypothetical protein [Lewinellaceae bacterium]
MLLTFTACIDEKAPKGRYEKIATAYCECTAQLAALNREAQAAGPGKLNSFFKKMESEYSKAKECTATVIGQFGHLNGAELDSVNILLKTQCPDLADKREQLQELLGK